MATPPRTPTTNPEQKLIDDVTALLRTHGYADITSVTSSQGVNVSGMKGGGGALFHLTPQRSAKAEPSQSGGGLEAERPTGVAVMPTVPDLRAEMKRDPAGTAKLLGLTGEFVTHILSTERTA